MNNFSSISQAKQRGFVLITTIVLMIMLMVLALAGVSMNTSQTRVAGNATDAEISFEKTEGAINEAINNLINGTYGVDSFLRNNNGLYLFDQSSTPIWQTVNWSSTGSVINSFHGNSGAQSSYIIEQLPSVIQPGQNMKSPTHVYRITGRSVGASGNYSILLQSTLQIQQ